MPQPHDYSDLHDKLILNALSMDSNVSKKEQLLAPNAIVLVLKFDSKIESISDVEDPLVPPTLRITATRGVGLLSAHVAGDQERYAQAFDIENLSKDRLIRVVTSILLSSLNTITRQRSKQALEAAAEEIPIDTVAEEEST